MDSKHIYHLPGLLQQEFTSPHRIGGSGAQRNGRSLPERKKNQTEPCATTDPEHCFWRRAEYTRAEEEQGYKKEIATAANPEAVRAM